jgi:hypothetical protein
MPAVVHKTVYRESTNSFRNTEASEHSSGPDVRCRRLAMSPQFLCLSYILHTPR